VTHRRIEDVTTWYVMKGSRCSFWPPGGRCEKDAAVWLVSPERRVIGLYCAEHGNGAVAEYAQKLGEHWRALPIAETRRDQAVTP